MYIESGGATRGGSGGADGVDKRAEMSRLSRENGDGQPSAETDGDRMLTEERPLHRQDKGEQARHRDRHEQEPPPDNDNKAPRPLDDDTEEDLQTAADVVLIAYGIDSTLPGGFLP